LIYDPLMILSDHVKGIFLLNQLVLSKPFTFVCIFLFSINSCLLLSNTLFAAWKISPSVPVLNLLPFDCCDDVEHERDSESELSLDSLSDDSNKSSSLFLIVLGLRISPVSLSRIQNGISGYLMSTVGFSQIFSPDSR